MKTTVPASKPYKDFSLFFCVVGYICNANFVKFANITHNRKVVLTTSTAAGVDNARIFATARSLAMTMYAEGFGRGRLMRQQREGCQCRRRAC